MSSLLKSILESERIVALQHALSNQESILVEGLWNSPKGLVASIAQQATGKNILILTGASQEEVRLFHDFSLFTQCPVIDFPSWETMPSENIPPSPDIVGERYKVFKANSWLFGTSHHSDRITGMPAEVDSPHSLP